MPIKIEPIGGYSEISCEGYILNSCHKNNIPSLWLTPVEDLVVYYQKLHKENLASIYLRGSVPRGIMVNAISDIDSFCLTHKESSEDVATSAEQYQSVFAEKYSFVNGVELESYSVDRVLQMKSMRFLLKTQCLCIYGVDVSADIEPMSISVDALNTCLYLAEINDDFLKQSEDSNSNEDALDLCSWIFKAALRAAFEIVMFREQKYTRDIYYCWASYAEYYPAHSDLLKQALHLVINPVSDVAEIQSLWGKMFSVLQESAQANEHFLV